MQVRGAGKGRDFKAVTPCMPICCPARPNSGARTTRSLQPWLQCNMLLSAITIHITCIAACFAADFQAALAEKGDEGDNKFSIAVGSWVRQRAYLLWAVQELGEL